MSGQKGKKGSNTLESMPVEKLLAFQKSYRLALDIHTLTKEFPQSEQYSGIADQLRRSSKSIVSNLTEGYSKRYFYPKEYQRFLSSAIASCDETRLWLKMAFDLGYIKSDQKDSLIEELSQTGKLLFSYHQKENQPKH